MMLSLASGLSRRDFSAAIITLKPPGNLHRLAEAEGIPIYSLMIRGRMTCILAPIRLFRFLLIKRPDVLQTFLFLPNLLGRIAGKAAGIPVVVCGQRSTDPWRGRHHQIIERLTACCCSLVVSNSEAGRRMLVEKAMLAPEKVTVITNGVPPAPALNKSEARQKIGAEPDTLLVGTVGNLRKPKGYHYLLPAFREVLSVFPDARLLIAGDGPQKQSLIDFSRRLGIARSVDFLGFQENLKTFYASVDVFVLPSLWEGLPVALLEAMSYGLPVVSTQVSGIPEVVTSGQEGFLVEPANPQQIAEKLLCLLKNAPLRTAMGDRGRKRVSRDFNRDSMVVQYQSLYKQLTEKVQCN